ncbi:MAG: putative Acyl-CoA dehydrogenase [Actinomycetia bacterium]|nr:putative Acyl-CoA dehydrogenase [Actinomycetes bacterium]
MDLLPSSDQLELVGAASEFFAEQLPIGTIRERRAEPSAISTKIWSAGAELGLLGLSAPEDVGGSGRELDDEVLLFRELGRGLVPGPFLASVLGARVAALAGHADLARSIISGDTRVGLAERRGDGAGGPDEAGGRGTDGMTLSGRFDLFDAVATRNLLVVDGDAACLVETAELGEPMPVECIDPGTRLATAQADGARVLCRVTAGQDPIRLRGLVLAAGMLVGLAEAVRDQAVEHAKTREQFGRPIGVNQAIKHACADMAVAAEAALSQTLFAAVGLRSGHSDAEFQVLAAKVVAGRAAIDGAAANIQIHGGMGYTYEHDAHLYLERAHVFHELLGRSADHLGRLLTGAAQ